MARYYACPFLGFWVWVGLEGGWPSASRVVSSCPDRVAFASARLEMRARMAPSSSFESLRLFIINSYISTTIVIIISYIPTTIIVSCLPAHTLLLYLLNYIPAYIPSRLRTIFLCFHRFPFMKT
ncbi:hypothetical protein R3P38DRAFT_2857518 [Favolaschia claudopus]|uniref:Uncharacterized protein n=1 Tax=Favolaschia claudopus TaxID=2862362 RepID=A0AAW0DIZ2_9AGAR